MTILESNGIKVFIIHIRIKSITKRTKHFKRLFPAKEFYIIKGRKRIFKTEKGTIGAARRLLKKMVERTGKANIKNNTSKKLKTIKPLEIKITEMTDGFYVDQIGTFDDPNDAVKARNKLLYK